MPEADSSRRVAAAAAAAEATLPATISSDHGLFAREREVSVRETLSAREGEERE